MPLRSHNGKLLIVDSKLATHDDCCCGGGDCANCADTITGVTIELSGVVGHPLFPPDPDCYCAIVNDTYFVPWDSFNDTNACTSAETFDYDHADSSCDPQTPPGNVKSIEASYIITCSGADLQLDCTVRIADGFGDFLVVSGTCTFTDECDGTCTNLSCTDNDLVYGSADGCDATAGSMTMTIN